jgi:hypothetical protein
MPKWLKEIWRALFSKNAIIGWIIVLLGHLRWVNDLWDSLWSAWAKITAMAPYLKYVESSTGQLVLTVAGFLWIGVAAYFGARKKNPPTVSVQPPVAPPPKPQTAKNSPARIIEEISQIKSPMQQKEVAKEFVGRRVKWTLSMVNVNTHTPETFTLTLKETNVASWNLMCLISVDLPVEGIRLSTQA